MMFNLSQYYNNLIRPQYKRDHAPSTPEKRVTYAGKLVILQNIWTSINTDFFTLKFEILKDDSSPMIYNSLIFRVTTALQSLLDSIARLCNDLYPTNQTSSDISFNIYEFIHPNFNKLHFHKVNISNLVFSGSNFNSFANNIKHGIQWVGLCIVDCEGVVDIFDDNHIGLVDDVLYSVLKNSSSILQKLEYIITDKDKDKEQAQIRHDDVELESELKSFQDAAPFSRKYNIRCYIQDMFATYILSMETTKMRHKFTYDLSNFVMKKIESQFFDYEICKTYLTSLLNRLNIGDENRVNSILEYIERERCLFTC